MKKKKKTYDWNYVGSNPELEGLCGTISIVSALCSNTVFWMLHKAEAIDLIWIIQQRKLVELNTIRFFLSCPEYIWHCYSSDKCTLIVFSI